MFQSVTSWFESHQTLAVGIAIASAVMAVGMALATPWVVAAMPRDLFVRPEPWTPAWARHHPALRWGVAVARNVVGGVLVVAGVGMLVLPGQGVLTIVVGLALLQVPGKRRLVRWLVRRRGVWRALNWFRRRMGKPEFERGHDESRAARTGGSAGG